MLEQPAHLSPRTATRQTGILQVVDLQAGPYSWEIEPGVVVHGYAFNSEVPGPTIEARVGDTLAVRFTNSLPVPAIIEWEGAHPACAGHADGELIIHPVEPAGSVGYQLTLDEPGTYGYRITSSKRLEHPPHGLLIVAEAPGHVEC